MYYNRRKLTVKVSM